jgi:O-antigen ligase
LVTVSSQIGQVTQSAETARLPMSVAASLILAYVVITRIGNLEAAKLGGHVAGVPIFLTEIFLLSSFAATMTGRPVQLLAWMLGGGRSGPIGRVVWLIAVLATIHFALAFSEFGVYAARDFAIYMYSVYFVLTYFAVSRREHAVRFVLWSIYAGVLEAVLLIAAAASGKYVSFFGETERYVLGEAVSSIGSDDVGGIIVFSLAGLGTYILLDRRRRYFHLACALVCFAAITLPQTRSAIFGLIVAGGFTMLALGARHRMIFCCIALFAIGVVALSPLLPDDLPGVQPLQNLFAAVVSGADYSADTNAQFRLLRWNLALHTWLESPVFGVGFGTDILPNWLLSIDELNTFNYGMPHNTFLTILARTGVIGLALFVFPITWVLRRVYRLMRGGWGDAHLLAAANMICAMAGFGLFVLFFERPMNGATFWIMMAVTVRLVEFAAVSANDRGEVEAAAGAAPSQVPNMAG